MGEGSLGPLSIVVSLVSVIGPLLFVNRPFKGGSTTDYGRTSGRRVTGRPCPRRGPGRVYETTVYDGRANSVHYGKFNVTSGRGTVSTRRSRENYLTKGHPSRDVFVGHGRTVGTGSRQTHTRRSSPPVSIPDELLSDTRREGRTHGPDPGERRGEVRSLPVK